MSRRLSCSVHNRVQCKAIFIQATSIYQTVSQDPKEMKETEQERVARQAKLQKALSAAYLSHQIDELETKVQKASLASSSGAKGPLVVLDASALLFAPKRVRDAAKAGRTLIVPLEVFHTLDLLKKGSSSVATAARAATRYIEHASRQAQSPSTSHGLRMQRSHESKEISVVSIDTKPPKWVGSVLGCVNHFAPQASFWVAKSTAGPSKSGSEVDEAEMKYGERAVGDVVKFWAGVSGIDVVGVKDPLPEEKKEEKKLQEKSKATSKPQLPEVNIRTPVTTASPAKRAPPVLLRREPKVEDVPSSQPTPSPTILQRPPVIGRTIGRYLDNDDDEPPKPAKQPQGKSPKPNAPRGGFTLLQRDVNPPRTPPELRKEPLTKPEPKIVLLQRPRG